MLNNTDLHRYARQIRMDEIGREGQTQLKAARVLVVGAGGLGCPVLLYLSSMGVSQIGVIDNDVVDISNLHRQILFSDSDLEQPKVFAAKNIPAYQIPYRWEEVPRDSDVVVFCRYEAQSRKVVQYLSQKHNMDNLINLKDGIAGWDMSLS